MAAISAALVKELRERTGLGMMECKKALVESEGDIEKAIEELRKSGQAKAAKKAGRIAAEGVIAVKLADDNRYGVMIEVNSETDFVARDDNFLAFVQEIATKAFETKASSVEQLMADGMEERRQALVQKIGENISVRRVIAAEGEVVGSYVHANNRIGVLVALTGGNAEVAKDVAMHIAAVNPTVVSKEDMPAELIEKEREIYTAQAQDSGKPADIIEKMVVGRVNKFLAENSLVEQPFVKNPDIKVGQLVKEAGATVTGFTRYEVGEGIEKEEVDFAAEVAAQAGLNK
ncbi:elongation factor Ts [Zooshikella marina]|uniref:Elongation factor Ts n=1 Tax=Zooshikella ganghwensis TaxID=202772 RepID=A0A4P9VNJ9_9GAMM|nr:translation elongation factor Ts [Zooshikella ganghwensis]MBU2705778.1 elongation factor Ts [Zooshikella ganghwensis]RDH45028.1 elongation factor Ts [Zooshikella ganghwensis]